MPTLMSKPEARLTKKNLTCLKRSKTWERVQKLTKFSSKDTKALTITTLIRQSHCRARKFSFILSWIMSISKVQEVRANWESSAHYWTRWIRKPMIPRFMTIRWHWFPSFWALTRMMVKIRSMFSKPVSLLWMTVKELSSKSLAATVAAHQMSGALSC